MQYAARKRVLLGSQHGEDLACARRRGKIPRARIPSSAADQGSATGSRVHAAPRRAGARCDEGLPVAGPKAEDDDDGERLSQSVEAA